VVHKGIEQPELLYTGFYELEALARLLLRHRLGIAEGAWPLMPSESMLRPGLQGVERWLRDWPNGVPPISRRVGYLAPAGEAWMPADCLR
jgi:hypothetical protein